MNAIEEEEGEEEEEMGAGGQILGRVYMQRKALLIRMDSFSLWLRKEMWKGVDLSLYALRIMAS